MPYFQGWQGKTLFFTNNQPELPRANSISLLFIHGLGASSSYYFPVIPSLTAKGYRCITMDTYGNGLSPYKGHENTIKTIANDALALLEQLHVTENVVVVGHSMGGIVASHLASADEQGIFAGVILLAPTHPNPNVVQAMEDRITTIEKGGMEVVANTAPKTAMGSNATPLAKAFFREFQIRNDPQGYISLCSAIANAEVPDYAAIKVPALILVGDEDKALQGVQHIAVEYGTPKGEKELRLLPGYGHWLALEAPELVFKHISEYLDKISA